MPDKAEVNTKVEKGVFRNSRKAEVRTGIAQAKSLVHGGILEKPLEDEIL